MSVVVLHSGTISVFSSPWIWTHTCTVSCAPVTSTSRGRPPLTHGLLCVCAAKDKGEKKLFGFSFSPLMREDGTTLTDDSHELYVYKVPHQGAPRHFLSDQTSSAVNGGV